MKPLTRERVEKAEGDFQVAAQIMRRRKQRVFDAACFHAQQTVEKYFKARLCAAVRGGSGLSQDARFGGFAEVVAAAGTTVVRFSPASAPAGGLRGGFQIPRRHGHFD